MTCSPTEIALLLESFYIDVRKKDQTAYKRNSYLAARSAIHRHLLSLRSDVDLFNSSLFRKSNHVLDGVLKTKKKNGEEPAVQRKEAISDNDWTLINEYFADITSKLDPRKLTHYVWFHLTSKFCLRGREVQSQLKKNDIILRHVDGKEAFSLSTDFLSKNHQGGVSGSSHVSAGVICDDVQIAAIKLYLRKLHPLVDRLFQRAKVPAGSCVSPDDPVWFMKSPLSHNLLGLMMKSLSSAAKLSNSYTNHCLRATTVVHLKAAGVEDRTICDISGHKNVASLAAYDRVSPQRALQLSTAIDKHSPPADAVSARSTPANVALSSSIASAASSGPSPPSPAFVLNAAGATFSNVTFNIAPPKKKRRLSMQLKKTRDKLEMKRKEEEQS